MAAKNLTDRNAIIVFKDMARTVVSQYDYGESGFAATGL